MSKQPELPGMPPKHVELRASPNPDALDVAILDCLDLGWLVEFGRSFDQGVVCTISHSQGKSTGVGPSAERAIIQAKAKYATDTLYGGE